MRRVCEFNVRVALVGGPDAENTVWRRKKEKEKESVQTPPTLGVHVADRRALTAESTLMAEYLLQFNKQLL